MTRIPLYQTSPPKVHHRYTRRCNYSPPPLLWLSPKLLPSSLYKGTCCLHPVANQARTWRGGQLAKLVMATDRGVADCISDEHARTTSAYIAMCRPLSVIITGTVKHLSPWLSPVKPFSALCGHHQYKSVDCNSQLGSPWQGKIHLDQPLLQQHTTAATFDIAAGTAGLAQHVCRNWGSNPGC